MFAQLTPEWEQWLEHNILRGCDLASVTDSLAAGLPGFPRPAEFVARFAQGLRDKLDAGPLYCWPGSNNLVLAGHPCRVVMRCRNPAVLLVDGFLSEDECHDLIALASPRVDRSTVVDSATGTTCAHPGRTSMGVMFRRSEHPLNALVERRVSALTGVAVERMEGQQVMRYERGQEYKAHFDYFDPAAPGSASHLARGGQRCLTALMYLSTPLEGGATSFPDTGVSVIPKAGMCCLFASTDVYGQVDPLSLHAAEPVVAGTKWISTLWLRAGCFA